MQSVSIITDTVYDGVKAGLTFEQSLRSREYEPDEPNYTPRISGIMNIDQELYEAAYVDGIRNRAQEIIYITVPSMKPQMLFGAVMSIVNAFNMGWIGVQLAGANPTPGYAGQLFANHIDDFAYVRYEMGYASAVSVALLCMVWVCSKVANGLFAEKDEY